VEGLFLTSLTAIYMFFLSHTGLFPTVCFQESAAARFILLDFDSSKVFFCSS